MPDSHKQFKRPPRKYAPKGLKILFEDRDIIVVDKDCGLLTMGNERERERTAHNNLMDYVTKGNVKSPHRVFIVHRLDRETSGVLVFAKREKGVHKMYSATNAEQKKQGKHAKTEYRVIQKNATHSLVELNILTGRKHQIRVHLSDKGCAILGDKKYGNDGKGEKGVKRLALHAAKLAIRHPYTKREMVIEAPMPGYFMGLVSE